MKKDLCVKEIFNDFVSKVILSEFELEILLKYIKNESIVQISNDTLQSTSTVSRTIAHLKTKYNKYKEIEIAKLKVFLRE